MRATGIPAREPVMTESQPAYTPSGEQLEITFGDQRATVVEVGGALRSYQRGEWAILDGYAADEMCTGARGHTLLPWPNRIRDGAYSFAGQDYQLALTEPAQHNAIHGLVRWSDWTVAERRAERVRMAHVLHPQEGYPFALALTIEYTLSGDGLAVTTTATNVGDLACPYGTGAHPYVTVGTDRLDPATLEVPAATWLESDDRQIPVAGRPVAGTPYDFREPRVIGETKLDTGYTDLLRDADGRARVALGAPEGGARVAVWLDASYAYVMAFTGDALPQPERRRRGLGVEPMTCAPNAFQSGEGLVRLEPGATHAGSWGIESDGRSGS
jgi:aldose 1-epimerase